MAPVSPNSNSVIILTVSGRLGTVPLELLSSLSGHPVPYDTLFLEMLEVRLGKRTEFVIRRNVISAFGVLSAILRKRRFEITGACSANCGSDSSAVSLCAAVYNSPSVGFGNGRA